jgi:single-strand DNA-binding protein
VANDLNRCEFIGRLGRDPEVKFTQTGKAVCNLRLACASSFKDKYTDAKIEKTEWIPVTVWGNLAEICGKYLKKGSQIYIAGRMQSREWEDKEGGKRKETEIVADHMQMLGGASIGKPAHVRASEPVKAFDAEFDDDIPF